MKPFLLIITFLLIANSLFSQDAEAYYNKGIDAIKEGKLDDAIQNFDKSIYIKNDEFAVWYNRGIVKLWQKKYMEAIEDFDQTITLNPSFKKAYNSRAGAKKRITDYEGAIDDYNKAIELDKNYIDAIYNKAALYEYLGNREEACDGFKMAYKLGDKDSKDKVNKCKEKPSKNTYSISRLTKVAADSSYGFTPENPIFVGSGLAGGPSNQRAYLDLLRDKRGKPIDYVRVRSCCSYESENGLFGSGMLDIYEISYLDLEGNQQKAQVYISFYDYEEPQILFGFDTVLNRF